MSGNKARPGAYGRELGDVELPRGGTATFLKPRMTRHHDLIAAAPTFTEAIRKARQRALRVAYEDRLQSLMVEDERDEKEIAFCEKMIARLTEMAGEAEPVEAVAPSEEVAAVAEYLAEHTKDLRGIPEYDWREMDEDQRVEFWDLIGPGLGTVLSRVLAMVQDLSRPEAD